MKLQAHPRLYVEPARLRLLRQPLSKADTILHPAQRHTSRIARDALRAAEFDWKLNRHNAHLIRARLLQRRVVSLLVRYFQTRQRRYRDAAVAHIDTMGRWEYWSWITWRVGNPDPLATFDLSYGENSATLAIAYDWLHGELSAAEKQRFLDYGRRRSFLPFLRHTRGGRRRKPIWWFGHPNCNWNSVCAGGAGMLALAMREDLPEAALVLRRVQRSFQPFMKSLRSTAGGWPEGVGYWNYGMRYAFMFLLSHENATGRSHPLLRQRATRQTLWFPLDFSPRGVACGFGDHNRWEPLPIHFAVARRLREPAVVRALIDVGPGQSDQQQWPNDAEALLLCPRAAETQRLPTLKRRGPVVKRYRGLDWVVLADRLPMPRLYASVRGGDLHAPHVHLDLMSFQFVVDGQPMIVNLGPEEYLDSTFGPRQFELYEKSAQSKSTLFINGLGIKPESSVRTRVVRAGDTVGVRIDGTGAMGAQRGAPVAAFCGRLFLLLAGKALLVVDRFELNHVGRIESRMFTPAAARFGRSGVVLRRGGIRLRLAYASDMPAILQRSQNMPTTPGKPVTVLRWCSADTHERATLATLLSPGRGAASVRCRPDGDGIVVEARGPGWRRRVRLTDRLTLRG